MHPWEVVTIRTLWCRKYLKEKNFTDIDSRILKLFNNFSERVQWIKKKVSWDKPSLLLPRYPFGKETNATEQFAVHQLSSQQIFLYVKLNFYLSENCILFLNLDNTEILIWYIMKQFYTWKKTYLTKIDFHNRTTNNDNWTLTILKFYLQYNIYNIIILNTLWTYWCDDCSTEIRNLAYRPYVNVM